MDRRTLLSAALAAGMLVATAGASFAQQGGPGGFRGRGGFGGMLGLLRMPEVQRELKLEQAQIDLLQNLRPGGQNRETFESLRNLSPEERQRRFEAMRQQMEKQIAEILDARQMARLKQLELQQQGVRALARPEIADALKLSAAQRQQVQSALQAEREAMQQAFQSFRDGNGQPPSEDQRRQAFQRLREVRDATEAKLNAVLTPAQKSQFQQMQGAPFQFPERRFGPGGGRGRRPNDT